MHTNMHTFLCTRIQVAVKVYYKSHLRTRMIYKKAPSGRIYIDITCFTYTSKFQVGRDEIGPNYFSPASGIQRGIGVTGIAVCRY